MDWHDHEFGGYRRTVLALASAAIIAAGVVVPTQSRTPSLNRPVSTALPPLDGSKWAVPSGLPKSSSM